MRTGLLFHPTCPFCGRSATLRIPRKSNALTRSFGNFQESNSSQVELEPNLGRRPIPRKLQVTEPLVPRRSRLPPRIPVCLPPGVSQSGIPPLVRRRTLATKLLLVRHATTKIVQPLSSLPSPTVMDGGLPPPPSLPNPARAADAADAPPHAWKEKQLHLPSTAPPSTEARRRNFEGRRSSRRGG